VISATAPTSSSLPDPTLIEHFHAGDAGAFEILFERHYPAAVSAAQRILGTRAWDSVDDVVQEGFIRLARFLSTSDCQSVRRLLGRIVTNLAIDELRRRERSLCFSLEACDGGLSPVAGVTMDPGALHLLSFERRILMTMFEELSRRERCVLDLRIVEGLSHVEVAHRLGITQDASKKCYSRARTKLQARILEGLMGEG